jgi:hypothetical protein
MLAVAQLAKLTQHWPTSGNVMLPEQSAQNASRTGKGVLAFPIAATTWPPLIWTTVRSNIQNMGRMTARSRRLNSLIIDLLAGVGDLKDEVDNQAVRFTGADACATTHRLLSVSAHSVRPHPA